MNRALILKVARDHRLLFALAFLGAVGLSFLIVQAFSSTPTELVSQWMKLPIVHNFFRMLLGADLLDMLNRTSFAAFAFVHPMMLVLVWGFSIAICTAVPAGEVDRGTSDLLLSLPISRWGIYVSVSVVVFACGAALAFAPLLGLRINESVGHWPEPLRFDRLAMAAVNSLACIWTVAGVGMAVSACSSRRGTAVAVLFAWLLASFALNFLGGIWKQAERLVFLSLLNYFRPLIIIRDARLDRHDLFVLVAIAVCSWVIGGLVFARRDIRTT
jgi:ABC-2 type transport system permease protein